MDLDSDVVVVVVRVLDPTISWLGCLFGKEEFDKIV